MKNAKPDWDYATERFIGNDMNPLISSVESHDSVSIVISAASPQPAAIRVRETVNPAE